MGLTEEQQIKFNARTNQLLGAGYTLEPPERVPPNRTLRVEVKKDRSFVGYLRPEHSCDCLVDKDGNITLTLPPIGSPTPLATQAAAQPASSTGQPVWPKFEQGEGAARASTVATTGISVGIKAWVDGKQKIFSGYLGKPWLAESPDHSKSSDELTDTTKQVSETTGLGQDVFGSGTAFVSLNESSHPLNPSSWPTLTRQALKDYSGNSWCVDEQTGCIHVNEELKTAKFVTSRFYNKIRQEICYAYTCQHRNASEASATATNVDDLIYDFEEDKNTAKTLEQLGYPLIQPSLPKPETNLVLGDRNSKLIMKVDGKPWYLGVAQFNIDGNLTVSESLTHKREENRHYLIAKGAADFDSEHNTIPQGQQYCPKTSIAFPSSGTWKPVNGMALDRIFFEHGKLCRRSIELARRIDSFEHSRMWTLTREADDPAKEHTLSILDIGVRAPSSAIRDIGFENHPESAYREEVAKVKTVRCFVALVPGVLDTNEGSRGTLVNVVNLQDIHPVEKELHVIYLVHSAGRYFTHHVYANVKLVDVDMSGVRDDSKVLYKNPTKEIVDAESKKEFEFQQERKKFAASFRELVNRDHSQQNETNFEPMDEVQIDKGCAGNVNGGNVLRSILRGCYNEFWKRVIDPTRAEKPEQVEMYRRWHPFYNHDFGERCYLAEPLSNFQPHEIHVVRVADYLRECDRTCRNTVTGYDYNMIAAHFLSGVASSNQSTVGEADAALESTMIQVNVPDERIKCIIYDFKGVETLTTSYYNGDAEEQAMAYFRQTLDLTRGETHPQRLYDARRLADSELERKAIRKKVLLREPDIKDMIVKGYKWKAGNREVIVDFRGIITEKWFYFVNSVDMNSRVKVGVANLPFNCRAATVDSHRLADVFLHGTYSDMKNAKKLWLRTSTSSERKSTKYQIYGSVWSKDPQQVVGILGGQKRLHVAEASTFSTRKEDNHTVVFINNIDYEDIDMQHTNIASDSKQVLSISLSLAESQDLNHYTRAIAVPVFDVCKGYPLQGFYRPVDMSLEKLNDNGTRRLNDHSKAILPRRTKTGFRKINTEPKRDKNSDKNKVSHKNVDGVIHHIAVEPQDEGNQAQPLTMAVIVSSLSTILAASLLAQFC
ncbi:hypothetical protein HDE_03532 [Halotydeus destructor]|nr:hypothetical protein HDE_03532 [Halotydeus destructor]